MIHRSRMALALTLVLPFVLVPGAAAQEGMEPVFPAPTLMVGYIANAPDQLVGGGGAWLPGFLDGWGIYADYKVDSDSPADESNFLADLSGQEAEALGDQRRVERSSYSTINVAVVRAFRADVVVYLGGGVSEERVFAEFLDETGNRGAFGNYWVEYENIGGLRPNFMAGIFFRLARNITAQFGAEAVPSGFTVGLLFTL